MLAGFNKLTFTCPAQRLIFDIASFPARSVGALGFAYKSREGVEQLLILVIDWLLTQKVCVWGV